MKEKAIQMVHAKENLQDGNIFHNQRFFVEIFYMFLLEA